MGWITHCEVCKQKAPQFEEVKLPMGSFETSTLIVCMKCAAAFNKDFVLPVVRDSSVDFELNLFQGSLGQLIVTSLLRSFGYEINSFGYENHFSALVGEISRSSESAAMKLRSMPDLVAHNRTLSATWLLEVKTHVSSHEHCFQIRDTILKRYETHWNEAVLVVVLMPNVELFAIPMSKLVQTKHVKVNVGDVPARQFDLKSSFDPFELFFRLDGDAYPAVLEGFRDRINRCMSLGNKERSETV